jgi:excisionase family DNA binding protein
MVQGLPCRSSRSDSKTLRVENLRDANSSANPQWLQGGESLTKTARLDVPCPIESATEALTHSQSYSAGEPMSDRLISVDEVAKFFGVKRDTVYKWIKRLALPARKVGRLWKFRQDEIEKWFDHQPSRQQSRKSPATRGGKP